MGVGSSAEGKEGRRPQLLHAYSVPGTGQMTWESPASSGEGAVGLAPFGKEKKMRVQRGFVVDPRCHSLATGLGFKREPRGFSVLSITVSACQSPWEMSCSELDDLPGLHLLWSWVLAERKVPLGSRHLKRCWELHRETKRDDEGTHRVL